jgi:hypothetical protein
MKIDMKSGYIGNTGKWKGLMAYLLDNKSDNLEEFFYSDLGLIIKLKDYWESGLKNSYFSLPDEISINLSPSYVDLWESGLIFFFDRFFALFSESNQKIDLKDNNISNMYTFYHPAKLQRLKDYAGREENAYKYTNNIFFEDYNDDELFKVENFEDIYFDYANLDSFSAPPAPNFDTLINSYVIADGNFSYNNDICLIYNNVRFLDNECESVIYNYDDGFFRYKSFAELFLIHCLSYFYKDIKGKKDINFYLEQENMFKNLFDKEAILNSR